jgi:integrase
MERRRRLTKLTALQVANAKPDPRRRREIPDAGALGLYLVIQPRGGKSWAVRYRRLSDGRPRKLTLEGFPPLAAARKLAYAFLQRAAEGGDPAAEEQARKAERRAGEHGVGSDLVAGAFRDFLNKHRRKKNGQPVRETTRRERARLFGLKRDPTSDDKWIATGNGVLKRWGGRRLDSITKADVLDLLDDTAKAGPILANRVLDVSKTFFGWCVKRGKLTKSPCDGIEAPSPANARDRVLADAELAALWRVADVEGFPFGRIVQLLTLTGCRLGEVREAPWSEIDLERRAWTIPGRRTKNGRDHWIPLSDPAVKILGSLPRISGASLVFTTTGQTPYSGITRAKRRLEKALASRLGKRPDRWTLHDLRRTFVTGLQKLRFPLEVAEACVNHKSGTLDGIAKVYARHDYADEKQQAFAAWGRHVARLASGKTATVVPLATKAARP